MLIEEIRLNTYKSITAPRVVHPLLGASIFIGKNNSGKSTVLDALYKFFRPQQDAVRYSDQHASVELDLVFDEKDRKYLGKKDKSIKDHLTLVLHKEVISIQTEQESKPIPRDIAQFLVQKTIRIGAIRDLDFVKMQKLFDEFKSGWPKVFKDFSATLQLLFPEIKTPSKLFQRKDNGINTTVKEFGEERTIERLGLGFRHIFIILLYFFHPRYDILLIDEPEIHLHPQMVKRLNDLFLENRPKKQIFLTTHSPLFVQPENLPQVYRTIKNEKEGTHFFSLGKQQINEKRLVQELNADNVEMFLADHVLLVEGISDRIFIRELLNRFFPTSKDIKVTPVHGKENIDTYAEILQDFHIPFSLLLDRDAYGNKTIDILEKNSPPGPLTETTELLQQKGIYILPHGSLEHHYPKELFERDIAKPLLALHVATRVTREQLDQEPMRFIANMLTQITRI